MKTYPLFKVHVDAPSALRLISNVFESGYINEGEEVTRLTDALKMRWKTENLSLTNSCTSALMLALKLAGVKPGDEVITTPMTCVATNAAINAVGAFPVWADVDPDSGMIDVDSAVRLLNVRPKAKAVMSVAWAGTPPDLNGLDFIRGSGRMLVLDAAHAFDAKYEGCFIHEWADYTCYSFQAIKHFTCGDGGALVCADKHDHARAKALKWFGIDRDEAKTTAGDWRGKQWDVDIKEIGYKFNMNNVSAAIGLSQLPYIDGIIRTHRINAATYDDAFGVQDSFRPARRPIVARSSHWVYTIKLDPTKCALSRDEMLQRLNELGIMAGVVHVPNDLYTCYATNALQPSLPGLREFAANQLSLPCGWWLDDEDIKYIASVVIGLATGDLHVTR